MTGNRLPLCRLDWIWASIGSILPRYMIGGIRKPLWDVRFEAYPISPTFHEMHLVWDDSGNISHNLQDTSIQRECEASLERLGIDGKMPRSLHLPGRSRGGGRFGKTN